MKWVWVSHNPGMTVSARTVVSAATSGAPAVGPA